MAATILIVDDHPLFLEGFKAMTQELRPQWATWHACSAAEALDALPHVRPDVVVIDVFLPGQDGFALLASIAAQAPGLPQVLISGREDPAVQHRARAAGARGFIGKTASPEAIAASIDAVLAGRTAFGDGADDPAPALTVRQREVLDLLADGCSNKEICHRLGIAERTVRAHLTELFQVLGAHSRMVALLKARALGLVA